MNIIARVKDILLAPKTTWPTIAGEQTDTATLYTQYIMILAVIPAVAGFIGMSLFGIGGFGVTIRVPLMTGLVQMVLGYAMSLAMVYVVSLIADALAPGFGGQKNPLNALKLVAYSYTAAMVGGIFMLIPSLGLLALIASLYSLYLLFLGVPTMMKVPEEKALAYTAVLVVCAIVIGAVTGYVLASTRGGPAIGMNAPASRMAIDVPKEVSIATPQGTVNVDVAKAQAWGERMAEVGKKIEKAQQSGDQTAMEEAMKEMTALQSQQPMTVPGR